MSYAIRTLDIGGILDYTFRLIMDHFRLLVIVGGVMVFPVNLVMQLAQVTIASGGATAAPVAMSEGSLIPVSAQPVVISEGALILGIAHPLITIFVNTLASGAIAYAIAMSLTGRPVTAGDSLRRALQRFFSLLAMSIPFGLGILGGTLACIVPGMILALMWYVAVPVLMFEGASPTGALGRSAAIMKGQKGKAFVVAFLLGIVSFGLGIGAAIIPNPYAVAVLGAAATTVTLILNGVATVVMYFSARCANESFDLELLAASLEQRATAIPESAL